MLVALLLSAAHAAGPHPVGWVDITFDDPTFGAGRVDARVYYPADRDGEGSAPDPTPGPFPLVGMLHGWLGAAWMYDDACIEVASHGYVVASLDTETGLVLDMDRFAADGVATLHHVEGTSVDPAGWLYGMLDGGAWAMLGHSMGGATMHEVIGRESRVETLVGFMPYEGDAGFYRNANVFPGSALYIAGSEDSTSVTPMVAAWFDASTVSERRMLIELEGAGHQAATDFSWGEESMPDDQQRDLVEHLAVAFLDAEVRGDEARWADLIGPGLPPVAHQSRAGAMVPALWATVDGAGGIEWGIAGPEGATATAFLGSGPGRTVMPQGTVGLADVVEIGAVSLAQGIAHEAAAVPGSLTDGVWMQVLVDAGDGPVSTRILELVAGSGGTTTSGGTDDPGTTTTDLGSGTDVDPDPSEGTDDPTGGTTGGTPADDNTPGGGRGDEDLQASGCSHGGAPLAGGWALLLLGLARRR
ncbi:MAG: dienelactone hydrolase [Myxococcota bacterium]|jgi:dienelactone hydrolase